MLNESTSFGDIDTFSLVEYFEMTGGLLGVNRDAFIILLKYLPDTIIREVWLIYFLLLSIV
jgi:hypothetical protein